MKLSRSFSLLLSIIILLSLWHSPATAAVAGGDPLAGDALQPPRPRPTLAASTDFRPTSDQPSAFLAGRVAVQIVFVQSDGAAEPSTEHWSSEQLAAIQAQVAAALHWWQLRLPNAQLRFDLSSQIVGSHFEPIAHSLSTEGLWIGEALTRMGFSGASYFDQAYAADAALRLARHTDWATTIFVANSANDIDGRFDGGLFAYAYIGGPFLVITSDVGPYGTAQMAPVVAHELGHSFGALDQYAAADTSCAQQSGYLAVPTSNSQANGCGTHFLCIMLDPVAAYPSAQVDDSALGQIGYRDSDGDGLPDPLDTTPALQLTLTQPTPDGRPLVRGRVVDQPFPSSAATPATINTIVRVEYRVDGGEWSALAAADGAYDSAAEEVAAALPLYDGTHTVELRSFNSVGTASALLRQVVTVRGVGDAPAYAVAAPALSRSSAITLTLSAPAGAAVQISEDPYFGGASWRAASGSAGWVLGEREGAQMLYVRFRDGSGLESPPFERTVTLDRTAPSGSARIAGVPPRLELQAQDSGSGVEAVQISYAGGAPGDWQPFQSSLALPRGATSIQVRFRDAAGNISAMLPAQNIYMVYLPQISEP